ncbi:MAG: hypothetical protein PWR27_2466 [Petroclostridium sp.]|nr:hypothetical protein [Petroclostridium sp.]
MNKPLVSLVVPIYNGEKDAVNLMKCMQGQTYDQWEMIFVDDQSTDNTLAIITDFLKKESRVKVISRDREPKGSATCRNIGLEIAQGKYLINIDADDLVSNHFIEDRVIFMEHNKDCDYATFKACSVVMQNDKMIQTGKVWGENRSKDILLDFLNTEYPFSIWNNIYRTETFRNEKWDENVKIYTDFSFAVPILIKGYNHKYSEKEECDYFYRVGLQNSMTAKFISKEKHESTKYLFNKTWDQLNKLPDRKKYEKAFTHFFILQFTRLLYNGTEIQQKDFVEFCEGYLNRFTFIKMKLVFKLNKIFMNIKKNKQITSKLIVAFFYYPKNIFISLSNKMGFTTRVKQLYK